MITFNSLGKLGRLGNQMFQIAATAHHAYVMDTSAVIPVWESSQYFKNSLPQRDKDSMPQLQQYREPSASYSPIPKMDNIDLFGYFQSYKYFEQYPELVRYMFDFKEEVKSHVLHKYGAELSGSCSFHVRRTDYLIKKEHPVLSLEYYYSAFDYIKKTHGNIMFVAFTDEPWYIEEAFKDSPHKIVIIHEQPEIDMCAMSMCSHNIVANSSFSWWGAWLNQNENKTVIAPDIWFAQGYKDSSDMCPKDWKIFKGAL